MNGFTVGASIRLKGTDQCGTVERRGWNDKVYRVEPALDDNRNWYTEDELEACNTPELPNGKTHTERPGAD